MSLKRMDARRLAFAAVVAALGASAVALPHAQTLGAPAFEVVSITRSRVDETGGSMGFQSGGRFRAVNFPVDSIVLTAFGDADHRLLHSQIAGPSWMSDRFDITAKAPGDLPSDVPSLSKLMPAMLRAMLEDRFKLQAHMETRQQQVYALVKARSDGSFGPHFRPSTLDCHTSTECGIHFAPGAVAAGNVSIANLVSLLSGSVQGVVLDRTTLTGNFDFDLQWSPGLQADSAAGDGPPSIFTAVQEQLGLKLESTKAPVDVVVVDRIERPIED